MQVFDTGYSFWDWLRIFLLKFTWIVLIVHKLKKLGKFWKIYGQLLNIMSSYGWYEKNLQRSHNPEPVQNDHNVILLTAFTKTRGQKEAWPRCVTFPKSLSVNSYTQLIYVTALPFSTILRFDTIKFFLGKHDIMFRIALIFYVRNDHDVILLTAFTKARGQKEARPRCVTFPKSLSVNFYTHLDFVKV